MGLLLRGGRASYLLGGDAAHSFEELQRTSPELAAYCVRENVVFLATHDPRAGELAATEVPT
jgi:hypothetical protein